jgi:hypothetical protein
MLEESIIKLKRSDISNRIPQLSSLELGEIALNTTDGKIFFKNSNNQILTFLNNDYYDEVTTLVKTNSAAWIGGSGDIVVNLDSASWRTDFVNNASYIGKALPNTSESASSWHIKKITLNIIGQVLSTTVASNVSWNDRITATYI